MTGSKNYNKLKELAENYNGEKVLFVHNAPPETGKDFICDFLEENMGFEHVRFKEKLTSLVKMIYSISDDDWAYLYSRKNKEIPSQRLDGKSPRDAMIFVSEKIIKPSMGDDYFGRALADKISQSQNRLFCCSDSGFSDELKPLIGELERENVRVFRIFRDGHTYEKYNDSRRYLSPEDFNNEVVFRDIDNNGTLQAFVDTAIATILEEMSKS